MKAIVESLSELCVEISNLDSPHNPAVVRARKLMGDLKGEEAVNAFKPLADAAAKILNRPVDDGGPAFPQISIADGGMSLRDYFAAKALVGLLADTETSWSPTKADCVPDKDGNMWILPDRPFPFPNELGLLESDRENLVKVRVVNTCNDRMCIHAYKIADSMLAARGAK